MLRSDWAAASAFRCNRVRIPTFSTSPGIRGFIAARESGDRALERLSTGRQLNRASDDPSGLVASEHMRGDLRSIERKLDLFEREKSSLGVQEGGLTVQSELLSDLLGIVVSAANTGGLTDGELDAMQYEVNSILDGIDRIAQDTMFLGQQLLTGYQARNLGGVSLRTESGDESEPDTIKRVSIADLRAGGALDLRSGNLERAEEAVREAIGDVSRRRGVIGSRMIAIDAEANAIRSEHENLSAAVSAIVDADYAKETAAYFRATLLEGAALSAIEIGRQSAESVLELLGAAARPRKD